MKIPVLLTLALLAAPLARRSLGALRGEHLDAETIASAAAFLVGSCSCEVKALNPGVDMLMSVNWDDLIEGTAVIDEALPPLTGLGSIVQAASEPAIAPVLFPPARPVAAAEAPASRSLGRNVFFALGAGGILVAGLGFLLLRGRA